MSLAMTNTLHCSCICRLGDKISSTHFLEEASRLIEILPKAKLAMVLQPRCEDPDYSCPYCSTPWHAKRSPRAAVSKFLGGGWRLPASSLRDMTLSSSCRERTARLRLGALITYNGLHRPSFINDAFQEQRFAKR